MSIEHDDLELVVLYENPEWQKPLFHALDRRLVAYEAFDLKTAAFGTDDPPRAQLYFNQASPSAYARGNARAVPLALALIEQLESRGARVLNGSRAFRLELSKLAQVSLMRPGTASNLRPSAGMAKLWRTSLAVSRMRIVVSTGSTIRLSTSSSRRGLLPPSAAASPSAWVRQGRARSHGMSPRSRYS